MLDFHQPPHYCFGCSVENPCGLKLRFVREAGDAVSCSFTPQRCHESYVSIVHGGIVVTVLDELMGNALVLCRRRFCFSLSLRTRFVAPLRTGVTYRAEARVDPSSADQKAFRVESQLLDQSGALLVTGTGSYQTIEDEVARREIDANLANAAANQGYLASRSSR